MERIRGTAASPGVTLGPAYIVDRRRVTVPRQRIAADAVGVEIDRLREAVRESDRQFERIKARLAARAGDEHYGILDAHQLMLHDERLRGATERRIAADLVNAEWALRAVLDEIRAVFDEIDDPYFRDRRSDVDSVGDRILRNLLGQQETQSLPPGSVIVAHDLSPADAALFWRVGAVGFAVDAGGAASHTAIMARSLRMPAVLGLERLCDRVGTGDVVVVDGTVGEVILDAPPAVLAEFEARRAREAAAERELLADRHLPARTVDGHHVRLCANIELPEEIAAAIDHGAEGIGLFRTEFLYMNRTGLPGEDEHAEQAAEAIARLEGRPVTFRTCDLGADKVAVAASTPHEPNPALGLRSMRLCLRERPMFLAQLRGLLRASARGPMRIMFPMIAGLDDLRAAKALLAAARESLAVEGRPVAPVEVGVMVEMPSAVLVADLLARECDFLSIGTNDLIQYALAVDRGNEHMAAFYDPLHPAVLRMLRRVVEAAHAARKPVNVCGEMAGDPAQALLLVGLGVDEMSMNVAAIPRVKRVLRAWRRGDMRALATEALAAETSADVQKVLRTRT